MLEIVRVHPGSTGERAGLQPGDRIVSINGEEIGDVIDFQFFAADERVKLMVRKPDGRTKKISLRKSIDDTLGLEFVPLQIKRCRNRCIFCFVDQMPPGCRKTLYVKDDDYRASFLYGNFITLGALSESDWERIFRQRLSPLYISVHSTDPELRATILQNKKTPPILESLKRLADGGIRMHTQIVLSPGVNDGRHLARTIEELAALHPAVSSIAVVPVGMTAYRKHLTPLRAFTKQSARSVLDIVRSFAARFKKQLNTRLVFASDEFYIKAGEPLPSASAYEDFPQMENGVGMAAAFLREVSSTRLPVRITAITATLVTGVSFAGILSNTVKRLRQIKGLVVRQAVVKSRFFGSSVTVAGLLTGSDILYALRGKRLGNLVVVPTNMLKEDERVFLDGMTLHELEERLKVRVASAEGFRDLIRLLKKHGRKPA